MSDETLIALHDRKRMDDSLHRYDSDTRFTFGMYPTLLEAATERLQPEAVVILYNTAMDAFLKNNTASDSLKRDLISRGPDVIRCIVVHAEDAQRVIEVFDKRYNR